MQRFELAIQRIRAKHRPGIKVPGRAVQVPVRSQNYAQRVVRFIGPIQGMQNRERSRWRDSEHYAATKILANTGCRDESASLGRPIQVAVARRP